MMTQPTPPESDRAYDRRAMTRVYRLAKRTDLDLGARMQQILEQATEAIERPDSDGEVIEQLRESIGEWKSKAIDAIALEKENGLLRAQLAASERERSALVAASKAADLQPGQAMRYARLEELGCVLASWPEDALTVDRGRRALYALAKRAAHELDPVEMERRAKATLTELIEAST
jgi:hypothetical protein